MKHKDAKMETTVIKAKDKRSNKPHLRPRNTDLENEIYRLKSEIARARLAVLEEVESEIKNISDALEEESYTGTFYKTVYKQALEAFNTIINRMKEAAK